MTTPELNRLTVPRLRDHCRRARLPTYQSKGKRLLKTDLVRQLARHYRKATRKTRQATQNTKPAPKRRQRPAQPQESGTVSSRTVALITTLSEQLIARALVDLPGDVTYNRAMHRILRGGKAAKDRMILQRKRLVAIAALRDSAPDDPGRSFWADRYASEMNVSVAGC